MFDEHLAPVSRLGRSHIMDLVNRIYLFLDIYIYKLRYQPEMLTNRDFYGIYKVLLGKINISLFLSLCFIVPA